MLSKYCPKCSKANYYQLDSPNLCGFCGSNLNDLGISIANFTKPTQKPKTSINKYISKEEELDEETENELPNIDKLEIEPMEPINRGIKLGVVAKQGKSGFKREKAKKMSFKQVEEIFKREAAGGAKPIDIGNNESEE